MKTPLPWQIYALIIFLSLLIVGLGIHIGAILAALGVFVVGIIFWDKTRAVGKKSLPLTASFEVTPDADGYEELHVTLRNPTGDPVILPPMSIKLSYTTHAGGTPALGGNGIDSVTLVAQVDLPETLAADASLRIAIDRANMPLAPKPHAIHRSKTEDDAAFAAKSARLSAAYATVCANLRAAPSLVAFLDQSPAAFVTVHFKSAQKFWDFSRR